MALADDVAKLSKNQASMQKTISALKARVDELEERAGISVEPVIQAAPKAAPRTAKAAGPASKESGENLGFKVFGAVGFILILLGLFYLYRYAVEQGYLGIGGRIAIGVVFSLLVIGLGFVFRTRGYERFSQLLTGGGFALLYFTVYAAYAFKDYRAYFGISGAFDLTILLLIVLCAIVYAVAYDAVYLAAFSFLLGYLAPVIIRGAGNGNIHMVLMPMLLLTAGLAFVSWRRKWRLAVPGAIASYVVMLSAMGLAWRADASIAYIAYLTVLFSIINFLVLNEDDDAYRIVLALIAGIATLALGLPLFFRHWDSLRGVFLVVFAAAYFALSFIAHGRKEQSLVETYFSLCVLFLTVAVPVQFEGMWIVVMWAAEGFLLVRLGENVELRTIRISGYIALGLAFIGALFSIGLAFGKRTMCMAAAIIALYASSAILDQKDENQRFLRGVLAVLGSVLLVMFLWVEITDPSGAFTGISSNARQVLLSIILALLSIGFIIAGFLWRATLMRTMGLILFGIVVLKILFNDLSDVSPLWRTIVTMIVGIIALAAAFVYVKNKERIAEYLDEK